MNSQVMLVSMWTSPDERCTTATAEDRDEDPLSTQYSVLRA